MPPLRARGALPAAVLGLAATVLCLAATVLCPAAAVAQDPPTPAVDPAPRSPQQTPALDISPGGAFWRALVFPGWGHAAIDAHGRGGFYFAAQTATVYTALRTRMRVGEAQDRVRFREDLVLERLAAEGVTDPELIQQRMDEDPALSELRGLLDSRKEQQEDMVALGIFFLFVSAADAYVSAHLSRFPEPLEVSARAGPRGPVVDVGWRVALPR